MLDIIACPRGSSPRSMTIPTEKISRLQCHRARGRRSEVSLHIPERDLIFSVPFSALAAFASKWRPFCLCLRKKPGRVIYQTRPNEPGVANSNHGDATMNLKRSLGPFSLACCLGASLVLGVFSELQAQAPVPQVTPEGLQLQESKDARLVYLKPGATFDQYDRVAIMDTLVEFSEDWQRDYNANVRGLQGRVTTKDMDRAKADVAAAFKKVFTEELQKNGGYQVVDAAGPGVLVLRPAILNLQVTAPDLMNSDVRTTIVRSAGQMTLYLELWDSGTNTIQARIMDPQEDTSFGGMGQRASRVSNKAAMEDILRDWAQKLRKHLDAARGS